MEDYEHVAKDGRVAWLRRDSTEWEKAWAGLCLQAEDYCGQPQSEVVAAGEGWQYMGTVLYDWRHLGYASPLEHSNQGHRDLWLHEFRNRCLKGNRAKATIKASGEPKAKEE